MQKPPGVARQQVTFLVLPRKVTQRNRSRFAAPTVCPALLDWSGGCGTRATRSNNPRRNLLTSLRYSAAHREGKPTQNPNGGQQRSPPYNIVDRQYNSSPVHFIRKQMTPPWKKYQDDCAILFRSLGLKAEIDRKVKGVRGIHAVDV